MTCGTGLPGDKEETVNSVSSAWRDQVQPGEKVEVTRTVAESDVYQFAGITGDLNRVHVDEEFMKRTRYGSRLVHGAYILGLVSAASTSLIGAPSEVKRTHISV